MENIIEIKDITKKFQRYIALDHVSVSFEPGKIHGIIGRNGSGKTVLLKCICGLMHQDSGTILVNGKKVGDEVDIPDGIGAIIETPGFLPNYSGLNNLKMLMGIRQKADKEYIKSCIELVGLDPEDKKHVGKYSLGMRQRLGIAQALMDEPNILLLDEPMNGLDNQGVEDMRTLFDGLRKRGCTILLASHSAEDIEILCDTVHLMDKGVIEKV